MSFLRSTKRTHQKNELRPLIDGETAYGELLAALRAARRFVYIATWGFDPGLELTRSGSGDPTIREVLLDRAKAGLEVKVLVWDYLSVIHPFGTLGDLFRRDITGFKRELIDAGRTAKKGTALYFTQNPSKPEGRLLTTGSDHQKFWVIDDSGKRPFGFVGGINLGQHEWDTSEHQPGDRRRTSPGINRQGLDLQDALNSPLKYFVRDTVEQTLNEKFQFSALLDQLRLTDAEKALVKNKAIDLTIWYLKKQKPLPPRHDVTTRIRGPAAAELLEEFRVRWRLGGSGTLHEKARSIPPPTGAKTRVQVAHTAYYPGPGAEQDVWRAYLHALKRAERFIYLENQYFTSPKVRDVIVERVRRHPRLQVVILLPRKAEEFFIGPAIALRQGQLIDSIVAAAKTRTPREKRVYTFGLTKWNPSTSEYENIYIHAKIGIIDDEWMTIGSANAGPRSFEFDTELNAFTNDVEQVKSFRRALWSEHLNIARDDDLLKHPIRAIKRMAETAEANGKKKSGDLTGRLVPMTFDRPDASLTRLYELIAKEFF